MKKVFFLALITLVSATFATTDISAKDGNKKHKKAPTTPIVEEVITLETPNDTISYADGMAASRGLVMYLINTFKFDTIFVNDFMQGFNDVLERGTDPKYLAYNLGVQIGMQVESQILPRETMFFDNAEEVVNKEKFYRGFLDGVKQDTTFFAVEDASSYADEWKKDVAKRKTDAYIAENVAFLENVEQEPDVVTLPSGLRYKVITQGDGPIATEESNVTVRYEGKMIDGTVFDSSYERDPDTSSFKPSKVIKGWTEALLMMPEGSKWELYIPQELAYGERQAGKIKPYSTLIFTVEVVKVE